MSSRTGSDFGSLGNHTGGPTGRTVRRPGSTSWVEVDDAQYWRPGLLVSWSRAPSGWLALVAWVGPDGLQVATVPSTRVRPARPVPPPGAGA